MKKKVSAVWCVGFFMFTVLMLIIYTGRNVKYVDVKTGRVRVCAEFCWIKIKDDIKETAFSQLWKKYNGAYPQPEWEIFIKTPIIGGRHSPTYRCLGIDYCQKLILDAFDIAGIDDELKKHIINRFVFNLSFPKNGCSPQRYAHDVFFLANNKAVLNDINLFEIETNAEIQQIIRQGKLPIEFVPMHR